MQRKSDVFRGIFSFFQIGSGPYPLRPVIGGPGGQLESLPSFQWDPESRLGTCPSPTGAPPGSIPGAPRLNLSDFLSVIRTNSRNWDPVGLNDPIARPQPLEMLICNSAIGNSNWGNWDPQNLSYACKFLNRTPQLAIGGNPSRMRAIVIEGAGPVGQPSPDTIHHRRPACPAPTSPGAVEAVVSVHAAKAHNSNQ